MSAYDRRSLVHSVGEAEALRVAARQAEDAGDFEGALRLVRRLPREVQGVLWQRQLAEAIGFPAMGWQVACWLVNSALRWALERPSGQVLEGFAGLMLTTLGVAAPARDGQLAGVVMADPVVADAGLFDGGLFGHYLASALSPSMLIRAGPVGRWTRCPASIWELCGLDDHHVVLLDCWTGEEVTCRRRPELRGGPGDLLYGRLVPVTGTLPFAFALPTVTVDRRCASRVLRGRERHAGPEERIRAVARSRSRTGAPLAG